MKKAIDDGKFLTFKYLGDSESGKTELWEVHNKIFMVRLGLIKWNPAWRQYSFYPARDTMYEEDCLRRIANFNEKLTKERRKNKMVI